MSKIQSDVYMDLREENFCYMTMAGGIVAHLLNSGTFDCSDFAVYADAAFIDVRQYPGQIAYGAFAELSCLGMTKISNGYSEIKINQGIAYPWREGDPGLSASVMIGITTLNKEKSKLELNNLFGCMKRTDDVNAEQLYQLYVREDKTGCVENNCRVTDTLPKGHGLDASVWDLSDLSKPKIKYSPK